MVYPYLSLSQSRSFFS